MIDLYTWKTPNCRKVSIMLEETGLPYKVHEIDIQQRAQFSPEYLKINPNNKVPAIIDHEDGKAFTLFESGAILIYLAEKTGKFLSQDKHQRAITLQWLMFQMSGFGPMLGQTHHFLGNASGNAYAVERYTHETKRLYGVLDKRLSESQYLASEYSIADIAIFPWVAIHERHLINLEDFTHIQHWFERINIRPAVQKGMQIPA
jgi:GSH-dependent disulfide-bond oxidoreductase